MILQGCREEGKCATQSCLLSLPCYCFRPLEKHSQHNSEAKLGTAVSTVYALSSIKSSMQGLWLIWEVRRKATVWSDGSVGERWRAQVFCALVSPYRKAVALWSTTITMGKRCGNWMLRAHSSIQGTLLAQIVETDQFHFAISNFQETITTTNRWTQLYYALWYEYLKWLHVSFQENVEIPRWSVGNAPAAAKPATLFSKMKYSFDAFLFTSY